MSLEPKRDANWRLKRAQSLRSAYARGEVNMEVEDATVIRILDFWKNPDNDPDLSDAFLLGTEYPLVAQDIKNCIMEGEGTAFIASKHGISESVIKIYAELYCDPSRVGSKSQQLISYVSSLPMQARKEFLMSKRTGTAYEVAIRGREALREKSLTPKDIMEMVSHILVQAYVCASAGADIPLDSPEQKTVLAYTNILMQYTRLLQELDGNNTDKNVILERMAAFTKKIPSGVPKIPALAELENSMEDVSKFKLAPITDIKDSNE